MAQLQELFVLKGHIDKVWHVSWSQDGKLLASCGSDKTIRIWGKEGDAWHCKSVLSDAHKRTIRSTAWSPCGRYLASASFDGSVVVWERGSGDYEAMTTLEGHENEVKCVSWACSGGWLATSSRDKSVWIWELDQENEDFECASVINSHTQDVKKVVWHPSKELLASASYDDTIKIYKDDGDDWVCVNTLESHDSTVWSLDFDASGRHLVSVSDDKTVKIWREYAPGNQQGVVTVGNDPAWKCVCTLSGYHDRPIYDVSWCNLSGVIATACGDDSLRVFSPEEDVTSDPDQPSYSLAVTVRRAHSEDVNAVSWNPKEAGLMASCSDDGEVKLWKYTAAST